jgi:hypothetical protein
VDPALVRQAAHEFLDWALPGDLQPAAGVPLPETAREAAAQTAAQEGAAPAAVDAVELLTKGS